MERRKSAIPLKTTAWWKIKLGGTGERKAREEWGEGRESAFTAGNFHLSVWEMDGWNQTPIKVSWKNRTYILPLSVSPETRGQLHPFLASSTFTVQAVILKHLRLGGSLLFYTLWKDSYWTNVACSATLSFLNHCYYSAEQPLHSSIQACDIGWISTLLI